MRFVSIVSLCLFVMSFLTRADSVAAVEAASASRGEAAVVEAEKLTFDKPANLAQGEGNVTLQYRGAALRADRLRYNTSTKEAWAEGHVRLTRAGQEWVAPAMYYNFETQTLKTDQARGFVDPLFVQANQVVSTTTNRVDVGRLSVTTCDYEPPHFRLEARRAEIWTGDRILLYNVTVRVGEVPVFWFPMMIWSLKRDAAPVALGLGQSRLWGFYVLTTTHWRLNEHLAVSVHLDERTQRGVGTGADVKYRYGNAEGLIKGYYLNDRRPNDDIDQALGREQPRHRYLGHWEHQQAVGTNLQLTANINKQSDTDMMQEFFARDYLRESEPESVVDATWRTEQFMLSALTRPQLNRFYAEVERLPEAKLAVNRTRLWQTPFYYEGESSAGYYRNVPGKTGDPLFVGDTPRADTFHQIVMPETLFGWLAVVPRAGVRGTWYLRAPDSAPQTSEVSRAVYDLGMETSFKLWQQWDDVKNARLGIDGLRHILQPFADYQWVPRPTVATNALFQFDTIRTTMLGSGETIPVTRYTALDFPANNAMDAIDRQNLVRFGLRQKLQTRRAGQPWDLVAVEGWTDYHLERNPMEKDFSNFFGTAEVRPTSWFTADAFVRHDMRQGRLRELNTSARVSFDRWSVGAGMQFAEQDSNVISTDAMFRLTPLWTAQMFQRFDVKDGMLEAQEYVLRQETHDWYINYGVRFQGQRVARDDLTIFFAFTLKAFPILHVRVN